MGVDNTLTCRLHTIGEVMDRCSISRSTIYRMMESGVLPRPVKIGERAVRWYESEIVDFVGSRPRAEVEGAKCENPRT